MNSSSEQRKLAAIMFTDMVGYSALSQRNEALALELLGEQQRLLRPVFSKFNGREIKSTGDGFLVEFASALEAAQCAIEIQKVLAAHNATVVPERHLHLRIGLHLGDVVVREADMFGDGVNIAARIEPLAETGGICLSGPVHDQVANKLGVALVKLGTPELKNIQTPVDVYRVVLPWQGSGTAARPSPTKHPRPPSARTLLFAVTAGLILLGLVWLVMQQRRATRSSREAAGRITSLAVKPLDDFSGNTNNAYLRGMQQWWRWSDEGITSALHYFQKAIEIEPDYARAHAGLVLTYIYGSAYNAIWRPHDGMPKGREAAQRAIQLDPALADAYVAMGDVRMLFDWDWVGAGKDFRQALELSPRSSLALDGYANFLAFQRQFDEAIAVWTNALGSDPRSPVLHHELGWAFFMSGQCSRAAPHFGKALELDRDFLYAQLFLGSAYLLSGKTNQALAQFQNAKQLAPRIHGF